MPSPDQSTHIDLQEVMARNNAARDIVAGFPATMPTLADIWRTLDEAFSDVPALAAEITRLAAELNETRLDRANLLAAARATIAAHHEGEPDPLSYLRDEINEGPPFSANSRRRA